MAGPFASRGDQADFFQHIQRHTCSFGALHQPVATAWGKAQAIAPHCFPRQAPRGHVLPRFFRQRRIQQALVKLLRRPADHIKHGGAALVLQGIPSFFQGDSGATGQKFECLGKTYPFVILNKLEDIAVFITSPAFVTLILLIDEERGVAIVVEWTKPLEPCASRGTQFEIAFDHRNDVVGFFDLFDRIVCQKPTRPASQKSARGEDSGSSARPCQDLKPYLFASAG